MEQVQFSTCWDGTGKIIHILGWNMGEIHPTVAWLEQGKIWWDGTGKNLHMLGWNMGGIHPTVAWLEQVKILHMLGMEHVKYFVLYEHLAPCWPALYSDHTWRCTYVYV